jgi:hypothetical protein
LADENQQKIIEKVFIYCRRRGLLSYKLNRYVKNFPDSGDSALDVLHLTTDGRPGCGPTAKAQLAEWLRVHNDSHSKEIKLVYGLDVYSLWESFERLLNI